MPPGFSGTTRPKSNGNTLILFLPCPSSSDGTAETSAPEGNDSKGIPQTSGPDAARAYFFKLAGHLQKHVFACVRTGPPTKIRMQTILNTKTAKPGSNGTTHPKNAKRLGCVCFACLSCSNGEAQGSCEERSGSQGTAQTSSPAVVRAYSFNLVGHIWKHSVWPERGRKQRHGCNTIANNSEFGAPGSSGTIRLILEVKTLYFSGLVRAAPLAHLKPVVRKRPAAAGWPQQPPCKRPAAAVPQPESEGKAESPAWYGEADGLAQNQVFLVTAAKLVNEENKDEGTGGQMLPPLKDPSTITKVQFRAALQDSIANPVYDQKNGGRPPTRSLELDVYVGVVEGKTGEEHHHAALKLFAANHRFLPFKLAMRWRHGIATHWSTSHTKLWSTVRYLHCTTPHKPTVDQQPELWTRDGRKLNLHEECQEPFQAGAWNQLRENRVSAPFATKPKKDSFNKLDFAALVLQHRLLTPNTVLDYVFDKGSKAMQMWVHSRQRKLKEFIQDALEMENARPAAKLEKETEWALIERLGQQTCSCGGDGCVWWSLAVEFFNNNKQIDRQRLAAALRKVICIGPCKEARVPMIVGKPNCAKSTVLDPCRNVFGKQAVLGKPKLGAGNGALGKLAKGGIRFVYFDDNRPVEYAAYPKDNPTIPVTDFLAMFCGQPFSIQVSQSFNDGHPEMEYHKGAAMTAKEEGLWDPVGNVTREEIKHMQARVDLYSATHVVGKNPDDFETSPACGESWCRWILVDSVAFAARHRPRDLGPGAVRRAKALPALPGKETKNNSQRRDKAVLPLEDPCSRVQVSAEQRARIEQKRDEARHRKQQKKQREETVMAEVFEDEENPLGLTTGFEDSD